MVATAAMMIRYPLIQGLKSIKQKRFFVAASCKRWSWWITWRRLTDWRTVSDLAAAVAHKSNKVSSTCTTSHWSVWSSCHVADHSLTIADRRHLALSLSTTVNYQPPQPASCCFKSAFYTRDRRNTKLGSLFFDRSVRLHDWDRPTNNPTRNSIKGRIHKCIHL